MRRELKLRRDVLVDLTGDDLHEIGLAGLGFEEARRQACAIAGVELEHTLKCIANGCSCYC